MLGDRASAAASVALQHRAEDYRRKQLPLFACFLDFAKAYDPVPQRLLWHCMHSIRVPLHFLSAVQSTYQTAKCCVSLAGAQGPCFVSCKGLKTAL